MIKKKKYYKHPSVKSPNSEESPGHRSKVEQEAHIYDEF